VKWFKHFSNARFDPKIRRLIQNYGLEGYGLYFLIVESIAFQLETNSPMPDLEETAHDIAQFTHNDTVLIQEIIEFCLEQKLFEYNHDIGRILCLKLLTHLDNTMSNNPEIKKILQNFKKLQETSSDLKQIRLDKTILDNKDIDESGSTFKKPSTKEVQEYIDVKYPSASFSADLFMSFYDSKGWMIGKNKMKCWKSAIRTWYYNKGKKEMYEYEDLPRINK
jgi:hypothetical protein